MNRDAAEFAAASTRAKPLWRRILKWTFRVVLMLVVVVAVGWGIFSYVSARAMEGEIDTLRAAGQAVTFAELEQAMPKVAEADDAAPFYKAALALHRASTNEKVNQLLDRLTDPSCPRGTLPVDLAGEIKQVLADNALALEMVDRGSARPQCACEPGWSQGIGPMLPRLSDAKSVAKLSWLRTEYLARQGRSGEAAESLVSSLRMMRMYHRHPMLITHLVKIACVALFVDAMPSVLEAGGLDDKELARLESALAAVELAKGLECAMAGELLCALESSRDPLGTLRAMAGPGAPPLPGGFARIRSWLGEPVIRLMSVEVVRTDARFVQAAREDWPQALEAVQDIPARGGGILRLLSEIAVPSFRKCFFLTGRSIATVRSAQVAVMVERYRLAKKRLPGSLEELRDFIAHDLPADPFTGKDLIYRVEGKGFAVYSVGEDKVDDGGLLRGRERKDWGLAVRWAP